MEKTLDEWLAHFEALHPVGIDMGLSRVQAVWDRLRAQYAIDAIAKQKVITVAGTNGKGSVCQMLSLLLGAQGFRVGSYTSPHIHHFRERVTVDGSAVSDALLVKAFTAIEQARGDISLSYFEATTLVGLLCLYWQNVDFAILEVGLGGCLDAVNIVDADAVVITSIGHDHEAYLGSDLDTIAVEKAGVCRAGAPCVYGDAVLYQSMLSWLTDNGVLLTANGRDYQVIDNQVIFGENTWQLPESLVDWGAHQVANAASVLVLLTILNVAPDTLLPLQNFSLLGRLERIAHSPDIVVDVAHNEAAAKALADYLRRQRTKYHRIYAVIGMLADKNHRATLSAIADVVDGAFLGATEGVRSLSDSALAKIAEQVLPCPVVACATLENALQQAKAQAAADDLIIAFGSFLVVEALTTP